jgi:tetratricopeptide (TPR) repeat protein
MDRDSEAVAFYQEGLKANPKSYYMYDEIGYYYFLRKKDYPTAVKYLEQSAKMPDAKPLTLHSLAHAYEKTGNIEMSLKTWERAAKDPDDAAAKTNLARRRRKMRGQ